MTTANIPSWVNDFDVVFDDVEAAKETDAFGALLDQQVQKKFKEGEVFPGIVVNVGDDFVIVDIGYKQEGLVYALSLIHI